MRKYLSSRCWLRGSGVRGDQSHTEPRGSLNPDPHKTDEQSTNDYQLSFAVSALSLLVFDHL